MQRASVAGWLAIFFGAIGLCGARTTAPGGASPQTAPSITIALFAPLDPSEFKLKLDRSIRDTVVADLTNIAPGRVRRSDVDPNDSAAVLADARKAGSRYVLTGSYAGVSRMLRILGEVTDLKTGNAIAAVKTTGSLLDLFTLEDDIADQVRRRVNLNPPPPVDHRSTADTAPPPIQPMLALRVVQPQPDGYTRAYVAQAVAIPAGQAQGAYNYYYSNPGNYAGCCYGWGLGCGYGIGFGYGYGPAYHGGRYYGFPHGGFFLGTGPSLYSGHGTAGHR